jgi:hypothetical protein
MIPPEIKKVIDDLAARTGFVVLLLIALSFFLFIVVDCSLTDIESDLCLLAAEQGVELTEVECAK